ncbi:dUTPase [Lentibacillus cibarius]|uniref:dUTPase n=1 Tax=Lentibacillus cibarius TaxID=2583219 RepID=A0A549YM20_9BACI|nr:dUTP diphosphatase [Lentibacillus cibarius]TRM12907.1 dUTPase [Lentibacillus cibarius]
MEWSSLYKMQSQLDDYIESQHDLQHVDLFQKKYLSLLTELGELANETRCFKFWSLKPKNKQSIILEEYVDGIHFILSLGLEKGYRNLPGSVNTANSDESEQFIRVYDACATFYYHPTQQNYEELLGHYVQLGELLGFDEQAIIDAYREKNEINHKRQDQGY